MILISKGARRCAAMVLITVALFQGPMARSSGAVDQLNLPADWIIASWCQWYQWLTMSNVLVRYSTLAQPETHAVSYDFRTKDSASHSFLDDAHERLQGVGSSSYIVSPNQTMVNYSEFNTRIVRTLGGRLIFSGENFGHYARWSPDNRAWVEFNDGSSKEEAPTSLLLRYLPSSARSRANAPPEYNLGAPYMIPGMISRSEALAVSQVDATFQSGSVFVRTFDVIARRESRPQWILTVPNMTEVREAAISPDGKRVCWAIATNQERVEYRGTSKYSGDINVELWISDVDGRRLHRAHIIDLDWHDAYLIRGVPGRVVWPGEVQWLPNGSQISYLWKNSIWLVAAR